MTRDQKMIRASGSFNAENPEGIISGVAVVFNSTTTLYQGRGWKVTEEIAAEAVDNALGRGDDVRCLFNHDANQVLGRTANSTLKLWKEPDGLHFECQTDPDISWQTDLCRQIRRGDINQCSFAFTVDREERVDNEGETHYIVRDIHLYDVSVVTYPAYPETSAEARGYESLKLKANTSELDVLDITAKIL